MTGGSPMCQCLDSRYVLACQDRYLWSRKTSLPVSLERRDLLIHGLALATGNVAALISYSSPWFLLT